MFRNGKFYLPILKDSKFLSKKENFHNICESCTILSAYFLHPKKESKTTQKAIGVSVFQYTFSKIQHLLQKHKKRAPRSTDPFCAGSVSECPIFLISKIRLRYALRPRPR